MIGFKSALVVKDVNDAVEKETLTPVIFCILNTRTVK